MAKLKIPQSDFVPHPEGQHEGQISGVEDKGDVETSFGLKHKIAVKIESTTARMEHEGEERGYQVQKWFTLSGHAKSELRKFRETMLGRKMSDEEAHEFDTDELEGRAVGYVVSHNPGPDGRVFANITNIWPLKASAATLNPIRLEYFLRLVDMRADHKLMTMQDATSATVWAKNPKRTPGDLEEGISRYEKNLRENKVELPPVPTSDEVRETETEDGLPF